MKKKVSICLNMIVRNESRVIKRCLESVKPLIDYWVIVDTGSTDGTQEIIRETMKEIPGELHERPWINFAHNRTEALSICKGKWDFALLVDADEEIIVEEGFEYPDPAEQVYIANVHYENAIFHREIFVNNHLDWYWQGVLHEQIYCRQKLTKVLVAKNIYNRSRPDGNRSFDPKKYARDIELLEKTLISDPNNSRYVFYLAQSYACNGDWANARKNYLKRAQMGGWNQEVYYSLYAAGYMMERLGMDPYQTIDTYAKSYQFRPSRAEPLFRIASLYFNLQHYALSKIIAKFGTTIPLSEDSMFVEPAIYSFGFDLLYADCCRALDEREEAIAAYKKVGVCKDVPSDCLFEVNQHIARIGALPPKVEIPMSIPYC